jgi:hypothetical protein
VQGHREPLRTAAGAASASPSRCALFSVEPFVHVVGQDVKPPLRILIDAVVARAHPVPVAVHQGHLERKELECLIDIQNRRQRGLARFRRCLREDSCQVDQVLPGLRLVLDLIS